MHIRRVHFNFASSLLVRLRGEHLPANGRRACRPALERKNDLALDLVGIAQGGTGSRDQSTGAAAHACMIRCAMDLR